MQEFVTLEKTKAKSENSWTIDIKDIDQKAFDLSVKNPNKKDETKLRSPKEILEEMKMIDIENKKMLERFKF